MSAADHDPTAYGRGVADAYDELYAAIPDTDEAVSCLAGLAGPGPVLELGVGTGRLALPLARRGLRVHGMDSSPEMVELLRAKAPEGDGIEVVVGDFAETVLGERFTLVVLAINTIFALPDQGAQVRCFRNAAAHLEPGGVFVVEAYVLDPAALRDGPTVQPRFVDDGHVELQVASYDAATQRMQRTLVHLREGGIRLVPVNDRYASPAELNLMAQMAGLRLRERWGDWSRRAFDGSSRRHVSVYERP